MKPKVIHTEAEHEAALHRIDVLMENDPAPNSPEGEELELLSVLVERYEKKKYPMDMPTPVAAIQFRMEQQGLKPKDLVPYLGSPSKVSEVLNGKRPLTLAMIRRLNEGLGIPAIGAALGVRPNTLHKAIHYGRLQKKVLPLRLAP